MSTIARQIAKNARALFDRTVPPEAMEKVKLGMLDTIGVMLAGTQHDACRILERVVLSGTPAGSVLVYGTDKTTNPIDAALINGTAAHMLDYDDSNSQLHGHLSAAIVPALLAAAQDRGCSGDAVTRAFVTAYETGVRLGLGVSRFQYTHGWHPTATVGIFPAVVGAGLLAGLDEDRLATALSIAVSMAAGVKSNFGSMTKPLHVGQASRNAMFAVRLAEEGFTSGEFAFEHESGYLNVFNRDPANYDAQKIVSDWGAPLALLNMGFRQKQYPCCYACLPPATALNKLRRDYGFGAADVERVEVAVHPIRFPHINNPEPGTALACKFSLHYCMACILIDGRLIIEDFEGVRHTDPAVQALMRRVKFSTFDRDNIHGAEVRVTLKDGRAFDTYVTGALGGSYENPLPEELVREKFTNCATRAVGESKAARLQEAILRIEQLPHISALVDLMGK